MPPCRMPSLTEAINPDRGTGLRTYAMRIFGEKKFPWWVHLLGLVAVAVVFCMLLVVFNTDIMVLKEKVK